MAKKGLIVSADEQIRYESIQSFLQGEISLKELASVLNRTDRQTYRLIAKVKQHGLKGVFHGNQGRTPKNKISEFIKKRVQDIVRTTCFDFNCLHMQERLREDLQLDIKRETLRSWCKEIGERRPMLDSAACGQSLSSLALKLFTQILRKEKAALNAVSEPFRTD